MRGATAQRYILGRGAARRVRAGARRRRRRSARSRAPSWSARATRRCSLLRRHAATRSSVLGGRLRVAPRTAPASCTWRPASARTTRSSCNAVGIPTIVPDGRARPLHRRGPRLGRPARVRRQPARDPRTSRTRGVVVRHETLRPLVPALLALRDSRSSTGRSRRGSSRSPTFRDRMVELNQQITLGARARQATAASASGWRTPATGRSAATASGARRSRCGSSDDPDYPRVDVYGSLAELERDFGVAGRPTCTARASTSSCAPTPTTRPVASTMRRVPEVLDCWFESGSMPFAQVHYPFENARVVRAPLPGRLHRRVHRPDPRLVLHAARAGHGAVRPAGVPQLRQPRHRARRRRPEDVEEPAQLPRPDGGVRHATAPTRCAGTCCRRRSCAAATSSVTAAGHPRDRAPGAAAALERVVLPHAVRQRRRPPRRRPRTDVDRRARPLHARQDPRSWSTTSPTAMDAYDLFGACSAVRRSSTRSTNWYIRRSRERFWAGDQRRDRHAAHRARRARAGSPRRCCRSSTEDDPRRPAPGDGVSVHLTDWPDADELPADDELVAAMDQVRDVCSATLSVRKAHGPPGAPAARRR